MTRVNCCPSVPGNGTPRRTSGFQTRDPALHRLAEVRHREGVSLRVVARCLGTCITDVKSQELQTTDLPLSVLYKWREVLDVPVTELLVEPDDCLSPPLMKRARLLRVMKTAMSILEQAEEQPIKRLAQTMVNQLIEIMPELREVGSWHLVGKRRGLDEYGRAAERMLSEDIFVEQPE